MRWPRWKANHTGTELNSATGGPPSLNCCAVALGYGIVLESRYLSNRPGCGSVLCDERLPLSGAGRDRVLGMLFGTATHLDFRTSLFAAIAILWGQLDLFDQTPQ